LPTTAVSSYPYRRRAPWFQRVTVAASSMPKMASSEESRTEARKASASKAAVRGCSTTPPI
jgi:hypothetical protein